MKTGVELIADERDRQYYQLGYDFPHDDARDMGELTEAALCYACVASGLVTGDKLEEWPLTVFDLNNPHASIFWPFDSTEYKPSADPIRNLIKAGSLIAAEIDRLQRRSQHSISQAGTPAPAGLDRPKGQGPATPANNTATE